MTQHISGIGDVNLMIEQGDFATAERFGLEFGEDIRMLNDLGWNPDDARDSYALTQPRHELIEALKRLCLDAEDGLDAPEDERRNGRSTTSRSRTSRRSGLRREEREWVSPDGRRTATIAEASEILRELIEYRGSRRGL